MELFFTRHFVKVEQIVSRGETADLQQEFSDITETKHQ